MTRSTLTRAGCAAALAAALALPCAATAQAGFLEELFGGASQPAMPSYGTEQPQGPGFGYDPFDPPAPRKKKAAKIDIDKPQKQKTTDLMLDKTLRPGDAVMMKDGIHIYTGGEVSKHSPKQFIPLVHAKSMIGSEARARLAAFDKVRISSVRTGEAKPVLISGRSAVTETPIAQGFRITDARGASIRYVGP